jgi:hypothetical protein
MVHLNESFRLQQDQADRMNVVTCSDLTKPVKCPSDEWVTPQKSGQCHTSMTACAASSADFRSFLQTQAHLCSGSTLAFDYVLVQCVSAAQPRTPAFACPTDMMRCSDGSCAPTCSSAQASACPSGSTGSIICPGNQVFCAASLSECSKKQPWNGCPVNQVHCPDRPGVCVASLKDCASAPGP